MQDEAAGWRLLPAVPEWTEEDRQAWLDVLEAEGEPADPELDAGPEDPPLPGELDLDAIRAECGQLAAEAAQAAGNAARAGTSGAMAAVAASAGRRGPGQPGSAQAFPGQYGGPGGGFAAGRALDAAPGCAVLAMFAEDAAGPDDTYPGVTDDELVGVICALDRSEAAVAARKYAAVAELMRRRAAPGWPAEGAARMPAACEEFLATELSYALAESRIVADAMMGLAFDLHARLPGTRAAFADGIVTEKKAGIIAWATQLLDPEEARAAEALVLGRAGRLTPGQLRAAIARAVMEVAPDKARKRREEAAKRARVERWAEYSGNAALVGRELPPAQVLAADQRVNAWARQLRLAGLDGSLDELRARAYLDLLLGTDSRPAAGRAGDDSTASAPGAGAGSQDDLPGGRSESAGPHGPHEPHEPGTSAPGAPAAGVIPPGFAGTVNLTIPLATVLDLADRPGEMAGIGPVDPALARDLARAAARNPKTAWCVTITDQDGHAIGHGCARPEPQAPPARRRRPGPPGGHDPPGQAGHGGGPGFAFTASDRPGPPGGYGAWRLTTGTPGQPGLAVAIEKIPTGNCDHRHQARGHDPGIMLRHLTQIRHATCTGPTCRRPATTCDFEHNTPYEAGRPDLRLQRRAEDRPRPRPTRSGTTLRGMFPHGQGCVWSLRASDPSAPRKGGKDDERRATACASHETAPGAQYPRRGCRGCSRRRARQHRDDNVAAQRHLELTGSRGGRQGCERRERRAGSGTAGLCCPQRGAEPGGGDAEPKEPDHRGRGR